MKYYLDFKFTKKKKKNKTPENYKTTIKTVGTK